MVKIIDDDEPGGTIPGRLTSMFRDADQHSDRCIVQTSDAAFETVPEDAALRLDLRLRQLWLAAVRAYEELHAGSRKRNLLAKARAEPDEASLFELASLASRLGLDSGNIRSILHTSPDQIIAQHALLAARKPGLFRYDNKAQCIRQLTDIFATATPVSTQDSAETCTGHR
jgi:hypothetical protein